MAYDEQLAGRIQALLQKYDGISRKKMFGGICFLHYDNMLCGVVGEKLMARVGQQAYEKALKRKHASPMDFTGKPMKGMIYVNPDGIKRKEQLEGWLSQCLDYVASLPAKKKG